MNNKLSHTNTLSHLNSVRPNKEVPLSPKAQDLLDRLNQSKKQA